MRVAISAHYCLISGANLVKNFMSRIATLLQKLTNQMGLKSNSAQYVNSDWFDFRLELLLYSGIILDEVFHVRTFSGSSSTGCRSIEMSSRSSSRPTWPSRKATSPKRKSCTSRFSTGGCLF